MWLRIYIRILALLRYLLGVDSGFKYQYVDNYYGVFRTHLHGMSLTPAQKAKMNPKRRYRITIEELF